MKDTAPKWMGILAVAAVFGLIAAGVAFVMYEFAFIGALMIGALVGLLVAILLMLGWREPAPRDTNAASPNGTAPTASAPTASAATTAAAAAPAAADPAPASADAATAGTTADTVATASTPAADGDKVKPSKALSGQDELAAKKGEWKYDAPKTEVDHATAEKLDAGQPATKVVPETAADAGPGTKPETLDGPRGGKADDLKQIKGVGPKMENMLHGMGFYHFDQVASWGPQEVAWVDQNLEGFKGRVTRDNWVDQAKLLAAGGETEFSKKVDKGGVY